MADLSTSNMRRTQGALLVSSTACFRDPGVLSVQVAQPRPLKSESRRAWRSIVAILLLKVIVAGSILAGLCSLFSSVQWGALWTLMERTGGSMCFVFIAPLLALGADTAGLALCVRAPMTWSLFVHVLPARLGCDALCNAVPGGVALAETSRPVLLSRSLKMDLKECVSASLMGKVNMAGAQALYLIGIALFLTAYGGASGPLLSGVPAMLSAVLLTVLIILMLLFYSGPRLQQAGAFLARIPMARVRVFVRNHLGALTIVDEHVRNFSRAGIMKLIGSVGCFLGGWLLAGAESYVILTLLGTEVSLFQGFLLEGTASLMRIVFFFLPSAIGAAELGYVSLIASFGIADPITVSAAYIVIKRSREALWMLAGFVVLALNGWKSSARETLRDHR